MVDKDLAALATRQHGVVSLRQLQELGLTRQAVSYRARIGRLHRVHRGVYAVGHRALVPNARWMAAVLACGPAALLSHRAALALWTVRPRPAGPVDVTVPGGGVRHPRPGIRVHRTRALHPDDVTVVDGIPVTSVARSLLDYARTATPQQLRTALEAAERLELLDTDRIAELVQRSSGRAATKLEAALKELRGTDIPWTRSELERRFLELIREAGLPEPQVNLQVLGADADFYWPAAKLIVEVDGYRYHRSRAQFEQDRRRDAERTLHGLRTIRLTQRRLTHERTAVKRDLTTLLSGSDLL